MSCRLLLFRLNINYRYCGIGRLNWPKDICIRFNSQNQDYEHNVLLTQRHIRLCSSGDFRPDLLQ